MGAWTPLPLTLLLLAGTPQGPALDGPAVDGLALDGHVLGSSTPWRGSDDEEPRAARYSEGRWIEYRPGDAPLILLAPHGGAAKPEVLRDRTEGIRIRDSRTLELTNEVAQALAERAGLRPYVVVCHLHRSKLDANRDEGEAAQGDASALRAWRAWHAFVEEARAEVEERFGAGLVLDIHGQSHAEGWIEWGYALDGRQLAWDEAKLAVGKERIGSSIEAVAARHAGDRAALLRGEQSLGGVLEAAGYKSVPSPAHPHPDGGKYFNGGYNTRRHGSRRGGQVDAVQMEVPRHLRLDVARRRKFAADLADGLSGFLDRWYDFRVEADDD